MNFESIADGGQRPEPQAGAKYAADARTLAFSDINSASFTIKDFFPSVIQLQEGPQFTDGILPPRFL